VALLRRSKDARSDFFPGFTDIVEIGMGSLATVYRAREMGTNRLVALKLLNIRDASPRAIESFERESIALGAVSSHPNIVTLFRSFRAADNRPVLVLELCRGAISDRMRGGQGLPVPDVVALGIKIAGALETAHRAEILHRDVKPQNVLITDFGEPALADFGVAMLQSSTQTTAGLFDFTTLHAAPELLEGGETSAATDVYELASSLYQLIAGKSAFRAYDGESPASVILRIVRDPVQPLVDAQVPTTLSDLLVYAMSKDKNNRPPTAAEFAAELAAVEADQGWPGTQFLIRDPNGSTVGLPSVTRMPHLVPPSAPPAVGTAHPRTPERTPEPVIAPAVAESLPVAASLVPPGPAGPAAPWPPAPEWAPPPPGFRPQAYPLPGRLAPIPSADPPAIPPVPDPARQAQAATDLGPSQRTPAEPEPVEPQTAAPEPAAAEPVQAAIEPAAAPEPVPTGDDRVRIDDDAPDVADDELSAAPVPVDDGASGAEQHVAAPVLPDIALQAVPEAEAPPAPSRPLPRSAGGDAQEVRRAAQYPIPPALAENDAELRSEPVPAVPTWTLRSPAPTSAPVSPAFVNDLSLDPMSLRRRVTIRSGSAALTVDDVRLVVRKWWRRTEIAWADVQGFEPRFDSDDEPGGGGRLVALTRTGPLELPATQRPVADLRDLHALLDAYRRRSQMSPDH
jgi:serine/threonine protein kinase